MPLKNNSKLEDYDFGSKSMILQLLRGSGRHPNRSKFYQNAAKSAKKQSEAYEKTIHAGILYHTMTLQMKKREKTKDTRFVLKPHYFEASWRLWTTANSRRTLISMYHISFRKTKF